ncbi:MAG: diguanylate cyclase [Vicinamibacterales bacterium]
MELIPRLCRAVLRHLWPPVEPALVSAGRDGEVAAARTRIALALLLGISPVITLYQDPAALQATLSLPLVALFVGVGFWTLWLARREPHAAWASYAGSAIDISLVTAYQVMLFLDGMAYVAMGSRATFTLYVFAIIATGLRYDPRLVVGTGLLSAVQWMAVMIWADASGLGAAATASGRFYPTTRLDGQFEELIVLAAATVLSLIIVGRSREIRLSSVLDGLTRLLNKAHFEERFALELERSLRHGRPLALAILDLDRFKAINDTMGHPAGDAVIFEAADRLRKKVRRTDLVARLGGDEFAVVLPETPPAEAVAKVEELCAAIGGTPIDVEQVAVTVTCSAGVCACPSDGAAVGVLVAAADKRLLDAKRRGRNRVVAESTSPLAPPQPSLAR